MCEKQRLEWPIAKYFTQPRRIGLIVSINPFSDCDRKLRKIFLSWRSKAVRFLPFGTYCTGSAETGERALRGGEDAALRAGIFKASGFFDPMGLSVGARNSFPRP